MKSDPQLRLVADIGGTNARFALSHGGGEVLSIESVHTADYKTPEDAIREYLADQGAEPGAAALAVACPVHGDAVHLTNSPWSFSIAAMKDDLGLKHLRVYNDFTAMSFSLPWLEAGDVRLIGGTAVVRDGEEERRALGLVGPGTGLGVSGLVPMGESDWAPLHSEGGHVGFAPTDAHEDDILKSLRKRFGRLSAERVISGMGIENVYRVASEMRDGTARELPAADVSALARKGDLAAMETLAFFSGALGSFAGDLVLTIGAWDGLYIGGGILMKLGSLFDADAFNRKFEAKGRFAEALGKVPRYVITRDNPTLMGLAHHLDRVLADQ